MRYIKSINVDIPSFHDINKTFELGDFTIFIGRPNSGKTRILEHMFNQLKQVSDVVRDNKQRPDFEIFLENQLKNKGISLEHDIKNGFTLDFVSSPRGKINSYQGLATKMMKATTSLKKMDNTMSELGTDFIQQSNDTRRPLNEQGTGFFNHLQILDKLHEPFNLVFIDEPEISQFPSGKIEILRNIIEELDKKQILIATHDPTLINQYLIKEMMKNKDYKIIIYSFSENSFKKVNFLNNYNPETHVGYLSQTYSGKPVHLIVEGLTEFYALQALLIKDCMNKRISDFPKIINKISLSHISGGEWHMNIHHLPDPRFYKILVLLDKEHSEEIKKLKKHEDFNIMNTFNDLSNEKRNVITLKNGNFDEAFEKVLGRKYTKPFGLSHKIWYLSEDEFKAIDFEKDDDTKLIKQVIDWCLKNAGCKI